jgi:predicted nucleotidyltransferase component of viral defense system
MKSTKNIAASVHQRLLNRAKSDKRPFNELLQYYAMERFLFRLSQSAYTNCFILKGALLLRVWSLSEFRSTMDIDLLGITSNDQSNIINQIRDIMTIEVEPDGIIFYPESIQAERIVEDADYEGIRVRFLGKMGSAKVSMQIDIGFGDIIYPEPKEASLPTILNSPIPKLLCYSRESVIAEKFEAMVKLGIINSRMKDFYDIWLLCRQFNFDALKISEAIRLTFQQRGTLLPSRIEAFEHSFIEAKQIQWSAFHKRLHQDYVSSSFKDIVLVVEDFLTPLISPPSKSNLRSLTWSAGGPWIETKP